MPQYDQDSEKLSLLEKLNRAEGRIASLERQVQWDLKWLDKRHPNHSNRKTNVFPDQHSIEHLDASLFQLVENARNWAREKSELQLRVMETGAPRPLSPQYRSLPAIGSVRGPLHMNVRRDPFERGK